MLDAVDASFAIEPCLLKLHYGGWLATTPEEAELRIGVVGENEDVARALFRASLERWKEISELTKY